MKTPRYPNLRLFAGVAAFLCPFPVHAIAPAQFSLAEVYQDADAVVVVRCGRTREVTPKVDESFDHKTSMTVLKRLHGPSTFPRTFELATDRRASCDFDLPFTAESKALLFLKWSPVDDAYRAVGRSEGSFELDAPLEAAMTACVPELGKILALPDGKPRDTALTEFYVKLCLNPTTRGIGVHSLDVDTRHWMPLKTAAISEAQNRRMADVVVAERPSRDSSLALVRLLADFPDPALDAYLFESLRKWDQPGWSTIARIAIDVLPKRLGVEIPADLNADLNEHISETLWGSTAPKTRKAEYFERMRPALIARVLKVLESKK